MDTEEPDKEQDTAWGRGLQGMAARMRQAWEEASQAEGPATWLTGGADSRVERKNDFAPSLFHRAHGGASEDVPNA